MYFKQTLKAKHKEGCLIISQQQEFLTIIKHSQRKEEFLTIIKHKMQQVEGYLTILSNNQQPIYSIIKLQIQIMHKEEVYLIIISNKQQIIIKQILFLEQTKHKISSLRKGLQEEVYFRIQIMQTKLSKIRVFLEMQGNKEAKIMSKVNNK